MFSAQTQQVNLVRPQSPLGPAYAGIIGSDDHSAYRSYHKHGIRQLCWAHLLRKRKALRDDRSSSHAICFAKNMLKEVGEIFTCQRYIEMNPVRAGIIKHPGEYHWSSNRINGKGEKSDILTPQELYRSLGNTDKKRQMAYKEHFRHELKLGDLDKIRKATNGNFALGTDIFSEEVSKMIARRVSPGKAGRPRKSSGKAE